MDVTIASFTNICFVLSRKTYLFLVQALKCILIDVKMCAMSDLISSAQLASVDQIESCFLKVKVGTDHMSQSLHQTVGFFRRVIYVWVLDALGFT